MSTDPRDPHSYRRSGRPPHSRNSASTNDDPLPLSESLTTLSARLGAGPAGAVTKIFGSWESIVGSAVAAHVRPLRIESDVLVVGADHPAWATQIRHLAPTILERLNEVCGETEAPGQLHVRVTR